MNPLVNLPFIMFVIFFLMLHAIALRQYVAPEEFCSYCQDVSSIIREYFNRVMCCVKHNSWVFWSGSIGAPYLCHCYISLERKNQFSRHIATRQQEKWIGFSVQQIIDSNGSFHLLGERVSKLGIDHGVCVIAARHSFHNIGVLSRPENMAYKADV